MSVRTAARCDSLRVRLGACETRHTRFVRKLEACYIQQSDSRHGAAKPSRDNLALTQGEIGSMRDDIMTYNLRGSTHFS